MKNANDYFSTYCPGQYFYHFSRVSSTMYLYFLVSRIRSKYLLSRAISATPRARAAMWDLFEYPETSKVINRGSDNRLGSFSVFKHTGMITNSNALVHGVMKKLIFLCNSFISWCNYISSKNKKKTDDFLLKNKRLFSQGCPDILLHFPRLCLPFFRDTDYRGNVEGWSRACTNVIEHFILTTAAFLLCCLLPTPRPSLTLTKALRLTRKSLEVVNGTSVVDGTAPVERRMPGTGGIGNVIQYTSLGL